MKMAGRVLSCCAALVLTLTTVSAFQKLNSINDLKEINFGQSVPKHSLLLLHWFASVVDIDRNNVVHLTFNPNSEDYGSHHYGNFQWIFERLPYGYKYYTIGNLYRDSPRQLPSYVLRPRPEYREGNRDRIIIRVRQQNTGRQYWRIDRVYLTQHYEDSEHQGTYDPTYTYEITTNLLREIREFSVEENQPLWDLRDRFGRNVDDSQLSNIREKWGHLACLGLLLFIVIHERYYRPRSGRVNYKSSRSSFLDNCVIFVLIFIVVRIVIEILSSSMKDDKKSQRACS